VICVDLGGPAAPSGRLPILVFVAPTIFFVGLRQIEKSQQLMGPFVDEGNAGGQRLMLPHRFID
jgi:hypothetical protein